MMAHPPCPVCASARVKPPLFGGYDYRGGYYAIVRCRACGLCFERMSAGISDPRVLARLELGDRAIVVARRRPAAALIERT
jgi:hypothetical protein